MKRGVWGGRGVSNVAYLGTLYLTGSVNLLYVFPRVGLKRRPQTPHPPHVRISL